MVMTTEQKDLKKSNWLHIAILIIATLLAYSKIFNAGFITWDDPLYVINNKDIRSLGVEEMSKWFSQYYVGNYHPLTMLSYAIDFMLGKTEPFIYHLTNILFHIANAVLVYVFAKRVTAHIWVALFVALLFAIHPTQTESVSWIAERKNVLYGFFFLSAMHVYAGYAKDEKSIKMLWVVLLGVASMLSKAAAISLPVALFAIDIWMRRPLGKVKVWLEKLPLFVLAAIVVYVGINAQSEGEFLNLHPEYTAKHTIIFAGYAYVQYIIQLLLSVKLSVLYPYPEAIGGLHILFLVLAIGIVALGVIAYRKKWWLLSGGIVFYTANIAIVLQFVQFGEVLMADRYLYIACLGIWLPAIAYLYQWLEGKSLRTAALTGCGALSLVFLTLTYQRNEIWMSELNFWKAIVETFPNSSVAQSSLGGVYLQEGNYAEADAHLNNAIQADPNNYKAWYNRGVIYLRQRKPNEALQALDKAIAIKEYPKALFTRALLFQQAGEPMRALVDIEKVLEKEPENGRAHFIKGDCLEKQGNLQNALNSYTQAIAYEEAEPLFYIRRGVVNAKLAQNVVAISDLETAIQLKPDNAEAWYWLGMARYNAGQSPCKDLGEAAKRGYQEAQAAMASLCK
jgi:tetratricopeptide (TPR) repeat protein